jgi:hypothetical protein
MSSDTEDEYDYDSRNGYDSDLEEKQFRPRMLQDIRITGSPRGAPIQRGGVNPLFMTADYIGDIHESTDRTMLGARLSRRKEHINDDEDYHGAMLFLYENLTWLRNKMEDLQEETKEPDGTEEIRKIKALRRKIASVMVNIKPLEPRVGNRARDDIMVKTNYQRALASARALARNKLLGPERKRDIIEINRNIQQLKEDIKNIHGFYTEKDIKDMKDKVIKMKAISQILSQAATFGFRRKSRKVHKSRKVNPRKSLRKSRKPARKSRKVNPRKSLRKSRKPARKSRKVKPRKSLRKSRKPARKSRKVKPRKSLRKSLRKSRKPARKSRKILSSK